MRSILGAVHRSHEGLETWFESVRGLKVIGNILVVAFLLLLAGIECNRRGWVPAPLDEWLPINHFHAISLAFTLLMMVEVIQLVFSLSRSVTAATGKQFEIISLILLRKSFKELTFLEGAYDSHHAMESIYHMLSDAGGALIVFILLGFFYRCHRHSVITGDPMELRGFVAAKRTVAALMLVIFFVMAVSDALRFLTGGEDATFPFFESFYTVLIFSDVLLVLISLRYSSTYPIVFRNSGFAVATVLIRLALAAPPFVNSALAVAAMAFALVLLVAYNRLGNLEESPSSS